MELKGSIQSVKSFEHAMITGLPYKLLHDGGLEFTAYGQNHQSKCYSKLYHLFPYGARRLWEERVNVRFYYDERFGTGTVKVSAKGIELLPGRIQKLMGQVEGVYVVPKTNMTEDQAREFGALNLKEVSHAD